MTNRFSHITSQRRVSSAVLQQSVSHVKPEVKGKPSQQRIGQQAYDTLMSLLSEGTETPTTPFGVLVANSTKRNLRKQIEEIFQP